MLPLWEFEGPRWRHKQTIPVDCLQPPETTPHNSTGPLSTNRGANISWSQRWSALPLTNFASEMLDLLAIGPSFATRLFPSDDRGVSAYIIQIDGIMEENLGSHDCSASNNQRTDTGDIILTCTKSNNYKNSIYFLKKRSTFYRCSIEAGHFAILIKPYWLLPSWLEEAFKIIYLQCYSDLAHI